MSKKNKKKHIFEKLSVQEETIDQEAAINEIAESMKQLGFGEDIASDEVTEAVLEEVQQLSDATEEFVEQSKEEAADTLEDVEEAFEDVVEKSDEVVDDLAETVEEAVDEVTEVAQDYAPILKMDSTPAFPAEEVEEVAEEVIEEISPAMAQETQNELEYATEEEIKATVTEVVDGFESTIEEEPQHYEDVFAEADEAFGIKEEPAAEEEVIEFVEKEIEQHQTEEINIEHSVEMVDMVSELESGATIALEPIVEETPVSKEEEVVEIPMIEPVEEYVKGYDESFDSNAEEDSDYQQESMTKEISVDELEEADMPKDKKVKKVKKKKKKKSFAWIFELLFLIAQIALYAVIVYGNYGDIIRIGLFALAMLMAVINLMIIFNSN